MITSYQARYQLKIGDGFREPGELVPEAHTWLRVESWVHHGRISELELSEQELREAIARYCPELYTLIAQNSGLDPEVELSAQRTPRQRPARRRAVVSAPRPKA